MQNLTVADRAGIHSNKRARKCVFVKHPPPQTPMVRPPCNDQGTRCTHGNGTLELYVNPCFSCEQICNCTASKPLWHYPDVLVRSADKHIVRLSGHLVRASGNLQTLVDFIRWEAEKKGRKLPEVQAIIKTEVNNAYSIVGYQVKGDKMDQDVEMRPALGNGKPEAEKKVDDDEDDVLTDLYSEDWVLALFDMESNRPTLGITKDILLKLNYFVCAHLEEVDQRVIDQCTYKRFGYSSLCQRWFSFEENLLNTFAYADWEEEFFNSIDSGTFFDIDKANQELLIWDLYFTVQKWKILNRGFPPRMVNGWYEACDDPEYDPKDKRNVYGMFDIPYRYPQVWSNHKTDPMEASTFKEIPAVASWWIINKREITTVDPVPALASKIYY